MPKYIEFPLEGGGAILIESPDEPTKAPTGLVPSGRGETPKELAEPARQSFDASVENVRKSADLLVSKLRALSDPPDEMTVSFSLKASGDMGNLAIGKAGAEANYLVTLKWRRDEKKEADGGKKEDENKEADKKEEDKAEEERKEEEK